MQVNIHFWRHLVIHMNESSDSKGLCRAYRHMTLSPRSTSMCNCKCQKKQSKKERNERNYRVQAELSITSLILFFTDHSNGFTLIHQFQNAPNLQCTIDRDNAVEISIPNLLRPHNTVSLFLYYKKGYVATFGHFNCSYISFKF